MTNAELIAQDRLIEENNAESEICTVIRGILLGLYAMVPPFLFGAVLGEGLELHLPAQILATSGLAAGSVIAALVTAGILKQSMKVIAYGGALSGLLIGFVLSTLKFAF